MKKLLLAVAILLATIGSAAAQQSEKNYQVSGNVWSAVGGGSRAAKSGQMYKAYISNEVAREICKKYGRTFVEPKQQSK